MTMPDKRGEYRSIREVRSSLYPSSAAMLYLDKDDVVEFPGSLADITRETADRIAKRIAEAVSPCLWPHSGHTTPRKTGKRRKTTSDILARQTPCAQVAKRRDTLYGSDGGQQSAEQVRDGSGD
jgi:hypothetical protein